MSEQIDWSKAPADATHWAPADGPGWRFEAWFKRLDNGCWYHMITFGRALFNREWTLLQVDISAITGLVGRPITQSWSGEGLPPVCEFVEFLQDGFGWRQGMVICCDMGKVIVRHGEQHSVCLKCDVRPLRTPEQIAKDEREAAISEMQKIHNQAIIADDYREVCPFSVLYDAGYRKP